MLDGLLFDGVVLEVSIGTGNVFNVVFKFPAKLRGFARIPHSDQIGDKRRSDQPISRTGNSLHQPYIAVYAKTDTLPG